MIKATGFVTAGGRSSRMGSDKALLELCGRPMIEYVLDALRPVTTDLAIIANSDTYKKFGLPVFADTNLDVGPLEAIRTALVHSSSEWVILVGCDMPFVTAEFLASLLQIANAKQPLTSDLPFAVVPLNEDGKLEPLCAVYSTKALAAIHELIATGRRKVSDLFERIPCRFVPFSEVNNLQNAQFFFENVNTPQEFAAAVKKISMAEPANF